MMVMFQYKGRAYAFSCVDEVLLDIEKTIERIDAGMCPEMPISPEEVTEFFRTHRQKKDPEKPN